MSEGIDYGTESDFRAPVMRIDDVGHGFIGVVYDAVTRQAKDYDTGLPKWFRNRELVKADNPQPGDKPVPEYVFHIAVEKGRGAFTRRDDAGETVKLSSGKAALDVRDLENEDIAVVFGSAWLARAAKDMKLNTGHRVELRRTTPARDEAGDRMTKVSADYKVLGVVDNPQPFATPSASVDYGDTPTDVGF